MNIIQKVILLVGCIVALQSQACFENEKKHIKKFAIEIQSLNSNIASWLEKIVSSYLNSPDNILDIDLIITSTEDVASKINALIMLKDKIKIRQLKNRLKYQKRTLQYKEEDLLSQQKELFSLREKQAIAQKAQMDKQQCIQEIKKAVIIASTMTATITPIMIAITTLAQYYGINV